MYTRNYAHWARCWRSRRGSRVGGESRGLIEAFQGRRSWGNRGSQREELRTIELDSNGPRLDLGGANRSRGAMRTVPEKAENQGWSRRKPPALESLRVRNSSGSVTAQEFGSIDICPRPYRGGADGRGLEAG